VAATAVAAASVAAVVTTGVALLAEEATLLTEEATLLAGAALASAADAPPLVQHERALIPMKVNTNITTISTIHTVVMIPTVLSSTAR
jgi:hypothetical protein